MLEWKEKNVFYIASPFFFQALCVILDRRHTQDAIIAERIQQPLGLRWNFFLNSHPHITKREKRSGNLNVVFPKVLHKTSYVISVAQSDFSSK